MGDADNLDMGDLDGEYTLEDAGVPDRTEVGGYQINASLTAGQRLLEHYQKLAANRLELKEFRKEDWTIDTIYNSITYNYSNIGLTTQQSFLIEGDTLILELLHNVELHHGQVLHFVYLVEQMIHSLTQRQNECKLIFFECMATCYMSPYHQLLREITIHHLQHGLKLPVYQFTNWWSTDATPTFQSFIDDIDPAFILVGDGYLTVSELSPPLVPLGYGTDDATAKSVQQLIRSFTITMLDLRVRVIRSTELRIQTASVMGFHATIRPEISQLIPLQPLPVPEFPSEDVYPYTMGLTREEGMLETICSDEHIKRGGARLQLTAYAIAATLADDDSKKSMDAAKTILLHTVLLQQLHLADRALSTEAINPSIDYSLFDIFLPSFLQYVVDALPNTHVRQTEDEAPTECVTPDRTLLDLFDVRLIYATWAALNDTEKPVTNATLSAENAELLEQAWQAVMQLLEKDTKFMPLKQLTNLTGTIEQADDSVDSLASEIQQTHISAQRKAASPQLNGVKPTPAPAAAAPVSKPKVQKMKESWDDEEEEEEVAPVMSQPAAPTKEAWDDEEEDDWEAVLNEPEPTPAPAAAAPAATVFDDEEEEDDAQNGTKAAIDEVVDPTKIQPLISIDNKLVTDLVGDVSGKLQSNHLVVDRQLPATTQFYTDHSNWKLDASIDDGLTAIEEPLDSKAMKRYQRNITYMDKLSAGLASGRVVYREVIIGKSQEEKNKDTIAAVEENGTDADGKAGKAKKAKAPKPGSKAAQAAATGNNNKPTAVNSKAMGKGQALKEQILRENAEKALKKEREEIEKKVRTADQHNKTLEGKIRDLDEKLEKINEPSVVGALLTLLEWSNQAWKAERKAKKDKAAMSLAVRVHTLLHDIYRRFHTHLEAKEFLQIHKSLAMLGFTEYAHRLYEQFFATQRARLEDSKDSKPLLKSMKEPTFTAADVADTTVAPYTPSRFQLEFGGPYMLRNVDSAPDPRITDFYPDAWQRELLDVVDARQSALVIAPTSAGKVSAAALSSTAFTSPCALLTILSPL